jgi:excisionase family DNA binding protein
MQEVGVNMIGEMVCCEAYTTKDIARLMGVSVKTVMKLRRRKDGPPFKKVGSKLIRYPKDQFHAWRNNLG